MNNNSLKGVNLGGWLVLERWMTPSVFAKSSASDEFELSMTLKKQGSNALDLHRESFITEADFEWLARHNFNAVRIPVGYWACMPDSVYINGSDTYVARALDWAQKFGIKVLIDFHAAPGSQNGWDHSGKRGSIEWRTSPKHVRLSIECIEVLCKAYASHPAVWGIELLNEPHPDIPLALLLDYYSRAYAVVRRYSSTVWVVMHDGFRPHVMSRELRLLGLTNIAMDAHMYQLFNASERALDISGHIAFALGQWKSFIDDWQSSVPVIVGEWSAALDVATFKGMSEHETLAAYRDYCSAQQTAFRGALGTFYWSLKTGPNDGPWSLQWAMKNGIFA